MSSERDRLRWISLLGLTLCCVWVAVLNFRAERVYQAPSDGVFWVETERGVEARGIAAGAPSEGVLQPGDLLLAVGGEPVETVEEVAQHLHGAGAGEAVRYQIYRGGALLEPQFTLGAEPASPVRAVLQLTGVFYLLLGAFVLWRRSHARRATHFYLYCLASFVLFFFSYTGDLQGADWTVYWMDAAALLLQPALFAHFCLSYARRRHEPGGDGHSISGRWLLGIYGSAAAVGALHLGVAFGFVRFAAPLSELRWLIDRMEMGYLAAMYAAGIVLLVSAYRQAPSRALAKQAQWVLGSAAIGLGPFVAFYGIPYFLGVVPGQWMNLAVFSLLLLPLGMAYAIARHRLLDVETALRRGMAYTLATGALVALYLGVVALAGDFFRENFPGAGKVGLVLAVIATGLLFQPLQRWIQARVDRYFQQKRYEYREALLHFAREMSTETNLDRMVGRLMEELAGTLQIERAALFLRDAESVSFSLRGSVGLQESPAQTAALGFLESLESRGEGNEGPRERIFFADWGREMRRELARLGDRNQSWEEAVRGLELNYYFACRTPNRLTAVLALGKTRDGELLSNEDVTLAETLAGYIAAAVENVSLLDALTAKARQYEDLQQFSENILESINVGLMAVDLDDRVQSVNTPLELMYPLPFRQCRGRKLDEIFPPALMTEFEQCREDASIRTIYRHTVEMENGQSKVLNIAIAPLLSRKLEWIGRLVIFDDVTDRVTLETQLSQAEKLSSIGLLAAGVAHEVNTPLTVISTQAQMLAKQLPPEERASKIVDKIIRQTFRASEIVNSLLNFSRTKGTAYSAVHLGKVISETLLLLDHQFKASGVQVESALDAELPPVHGNSDKLQQVFLNLFLNARDAMPQGGLLRISTWAGEASVRIEIQDTGVGIAPENLRRIYDPFFTTKGPGRGTGLGLAVCYGIVQEHAGKIQADSRPGLGTRFELEFPVLRKPVHA